MLQAINYNLLWHIWKINSGSTLEVIPAGNAGRRDNLLLFYIMRHVLNSLSEIQQTGVKAQHVKIPVKFD